MRNLHEHTYSQGHTHTRTHKWSRSHPWSHMRTHTHTHARARAHQFEAVDEVAQQADGGVQVAQLARARADVLIGASDLGPDAAHRALQRLH